MRRMTRVAAIGLAVGSLVLAAGCGSSGSSSGGGSGGGTTSVLVGAGSTFVQPLMSQWEANYVKTPAAVTITYGAIGSGGGIDQITARTVDFGASDAPLSTDQATACDNCIQIPWALGAVAISYNVKGAPDHLKLTGEVLCNIFLGKVTSWNDPSIAALNSGASLPDTHITPIYRSDGSGTSFVLTSYLSDVCPDWKSNVGASTQPTFPTGTGAEHTSGVISAMQATDGGITYNETAYVAADSLQSALVQNAAGEYPSFDVNGITAAAAVGTPQPDGSVSLVNPPASAPKAYPISSYTYAIVPQSSPHAETLKAFLTWAISDGQQYGPDLGYPAIPDQVVADDKTKIAKIGT